MPIYIVGALIAVVVVVVFGGLIILARFYRQVEQGKALIVNTMRAEPIVSFTGAIVYPIVNRAEVMDLSLKTIEIDRRGKEGLICRDNIRADIKVMFFVRVNKTREDVLKVAQSIGCVRASDQTTLENLFNAKFSEALKTVGKQLEFEDLYTKRTTFKDGVIQVIGTDLNGYVLDDVAIDYLEQTAIESLDPENILDSQGIQKITALTTQQNVLTNDFKQTERKQITKQNVDADEAVFNLERQRSEAQAKQAREIASVQAREQAEILRVQAEERAKAELARIKSEEEIQINEQNKLRQIEVAGKNRERVVGIETERVAKDRALEAISREREVELQRIAKEKALEVQRKEIADVVRARIAVDKTVATEEEAIKDLRMGAEAKRRKDTMITGAEAEAGQSLVKEIKAAEASEEVAKFQARQRILIADADLESADKTARAKIRLSEGTQAEAAAAGLAEVKVREADAAAFEKRGLAEARVILEKGNAEAQGEEKRGLAKVRVKQSDAAATKELGLAEAEVSKQKLLAEAIGAQEKGLSDVRIHEAEAAVVEKRGLADASAIREKLVAEATGLAQKAQAMQALDGVGKEHEEFRLRLQKDKDVELAQIAVRKDIAASQAAVLGRAFEHAKISIVGGDGKFFDQFVKAVSFGQSLDGAVDNGEALKTVLKEYLSGDRSLPEDLREVLSRPALSSGDVQNLTVSAVIGKLLGGTTNADMRKKLSALLDAAKKAGIDSLPIP